MASVFRSALDDLLSAARAALTAEQVTLYRDGIAATGGTVSAVPAETRYTIEDAEGARIGRRMRDYLIAAADYDFGGGPVEPFVGDAIEQTMPDGTKRRFEVRELSGEGAWRWHDRGGSVYRIHCVEIPVPAGA